jgi:hypothetical protein
MKTLLFLTFISALLVAQEPSIEQKNTSKTQKVLAMANPKVYAALGDVIYNNALKIEKLKEITLFADQQSEIDSYLSQVEKLKEQGYKIERGDKTIDKKVYLNKLRELSKTNDYYARYARKVFRDAIKQEDSDTFEKIINTGFIDTKRNKDKIINYYFAHQEEVNPEGVIQAYLDEDAKLRAKREAQRKYYKTKRQLEEEKIRRIRKNDAEKQAALEKKLEEEVIRKKEEIIKEQKTELFH